MKKVIEEKLVQIKTSVMQRIRKEFVFSSHGYVVALKALEKINHVARKPDLVHRPNLRIGSLGVPILKETGLGSGDSTGSASVERHVCGSPWSVGQHDQQ